MENGLEVEFLKACEEGDLKTVKALTLNGLVDTSKFDNGWTPLMRASCFSDNLELIKYLVSCGADVNQEDEDGSTSFFEAVENGSIEIAEFLLSAGSNIDHQDKVGYTALMWSAISLELESMDYLLRKGADLNLVTNEGRSFLEIANCFENERINEVLKRHNL